MDVATSLALDSLQVIALLLMGIGIFLKRDNAHIFRAVGWTCLGIFWGCQAPLYFTSNDYVNALGVALALPVFIYLGYHEYLSYKWREEYAPLRFVTIAMFAASLGYFVFDRVPAMGGALILLVAFQSVWLVNLTGTSFGVQGLDYAGNPWYYRLNLDPAAEVSAPLTGVNIKIVLACTAIQALFILGAFVFASRAKGCTKWTAFGVIAPIVYVVNLFRNFIVIWLVHVNGPEYFEFAHNVIGKGLSLGALVGLTLFAFWLIPELYEDINGLFVLPWRRKPGHDYLEGLRKPVETPK
ncbi:MAG: archaeosortase A [Euryarchaeota archaeon]|nr:archaeosortase A [Euryarchaeota archaeon]